MTSLVAGCTGVGVPGLDLGQPGSIGSSSGSAAISASVLEQLSLERINRARLRPAEEAALYGISLNEGVPGQISSAPKQPVAMNATLRNVAAAHAQDMLDRDYFEHDTPEGLTPFNRMTAGGYLFSAAGENLAWRGSTGPLDDAATVELQHEELFVDTGVPDRGHRVTMLNALFREVGVAVVEGSYTRSSDGVEFTHSYMQVQDYGTEPGSTPFVLGVVYNDANGNGRYDAGEGDGNVNVSLGMASVRTNPAGGYTIEVPNAGTYELRFSSAHSTTLIVADGDPNQKVDFVDRSRIVVNLGLGPLN